MEDQSTKSFIILKRNKMSTFSSPRVLKCRVYRVLSVVVLTKIVNEKVIGIAIQNVGICGVIFQ